MFFPKLAERVKFLKENEEGVFIVNDYFEERQAKENLVLKLIKMGKLTFEEIATCSGLTLKRVQMLADTL